MPDSPIPPHDQIVAVAFTGAFFVGIYFATFVQGLCCLLFINQQRGIRQVKSIQWPMLLVSLSIFVLAAVNHGVQVKFWMQESLTTLPAVHITNWMDVAVCTTSNLTAQLTDAVLVIRLWKIYNGSYRIITLPAILWIGGLVLTALEIYLQEVKVTRFEVWLPVNVDIGPGIILTPFWASTIILNLYSTSLIIYRLWKFKQDSTFDNTTQAIDFAISVIIESGSLYLVPAISHFAVWWTPNDFAINIISNINIAILGIAFNLIIIRLARNGLENTGPDMRVTEIQFQHENTIKTDNIEDERSTEPHV